MLACPICGSRRVEIAGRLADNSGWTRCQDCGHTASPRAFRLDDVDARHDYQHGLKPARHLKGPDAGLVCPSCFQHERFEVDQIVLTGRTIVTEDGWDVSTHPHTASALASAHAKCPLCGYEGRVAAFARRKESLCRESAIGLPVRSTSTVLTVPSPSTPSTTRPCAPQASPTPDGVPGTTHETSGTTSRSMSPSKKMGHPGA